MIDIAVLVRIAGLSLLIGHLVGWLTGQGVSPLFLVVACSLIVVPGLLRAPVTPPTLEVEDMGHRAPNRIPPSRPPAPPPPAPMDRLAETVRVWLADPRPAWETVEAFECDVERVLAGPTQIDITKMMGGLPAVPCEHVYVRPGMAATAVCVHCGKRSPFQ